MMNIEQVIMNIEMRVTHGVPLAFRYSLLLVRYSIFFIFFISSPSVFAQKEYHFSRLSVEEGLSDARVEAIGQDKYGFMWIGTFGGLSRYDGRSITQFSHRSDDTTTILSDRPTCMSSDSTGRFFIGFLNGLAEFDFKTFAFRRVTGLSGITITSIAPVQKDLIFLSTTEGLVQFNPLTYQVIFFKQDKLLQAPIQACLHKKGQLYLTTKNGLILYDIAAQKARKFPTPILEGLDLRNVFLDKKNNIWLTAHGKYQILRLSADGTKTEIYDQYLIDKDPTETSAEFAQDQNGTLWIAVRYTGLLQYDSVHNTFIQHVPDKEKSWSLSSNQHSKIFCSREGIIWCGGNNVYFFHPDKSFFTTLLPFATDLESKRDPSASRTPPNVKKSSFGFGTCIVEDKDHTIWMGTRNGLIAYNPNTKKRRIWSNQNEASVLWNDLISDLYCDKENNIWISTAKGMNRYNRATDKIEFLSPKDSFPVVPYLALKPDKNQNLWISRSNNILGYYDFSDKKVHNIRQNAALKQFADLPMWTLLHDSKDRYWFVFDYKGLGMYDPKTAQTRYWQADKKGEELLSGNIIADIVEDKNGLIWLSSSNGLTSFDPTKNVFKNLYHPTLNGMALGLAVDSLNRLWVGTGHGLVMVDSSRTAFTAFGISDGLPTLEFVIAYTYPLLDGQVAMPTRNGFLIFNPNQYATKKELLTYYAASFSSNKTEARPIEGDLGKATIRMNLDADETSFQFQLVALNYLNPNQTWFAYKLEGLDKNWRYSQDSKAVYTNVPGGNYTFRYKATANPNDWDVPEKVILVHIDTVFYKTWWFWSVILGLIAFGIFRFYRFREQQKQQVFDLLSKAQLLEKEKAVMQYEGLKQQLNPHFLFNSLASLSSLIQIDPSVATRFLENLSKTYRYILKSSEAETVFLRDEIKFAQNFVELQKVRFDAGFIVEFEINKDDLDKKIVPVTLQNMIENATKHNIIDSESPLKIRIFTEGGYLMVENNLQKKRFVETSNKRGLVNLINLYKYLSDKPLVAIETPNSFIVKIPLV